VAQNQGISWAEFAIPPGLAGLKPVLLSIIASPDLKVGVNGSFFCEWPL